MAVEGQTIGAVWREAVRQYCHADFLAAPHPDGSKPDTLTYGQADARIAALSERFVASGYGPGHRVALLMGNGPECVLIKLALNLLGIALVPVNPDYRPSEVAYLLNDSSAALAVVDLAGADLMRAGIAKAGGGTALFLLGDKGPLPSAPAKPAGTLTPETEASLIYTSGTTGRPKGCIISHETELFYGEAYLNAPHPVALRPAGDRVLNPLPLFHVNAGIMTLFAVILSGNCLIVPERFSASTWWRDCQATGATVFHYLGVVISVLMADRMAGPKALGGLRVGFGAGVEPSLHVAFEERFGIPLVECWGMTEMCRVLVIAEEPRLIHTRAMGRPRADLEVRVVDDAGDDVSRGVPGEMLIRHSKATPRKGFFSGYLNKPDATADAWRGGWFHTGDTVLMDETDMVFFVDRKKNIIRRAGENIAAAEVENCLLADARVRSVACLATPDDMREEEVLACIVLADGIPRTEETARALFDHAMAGLAYYKPPGWVRFMDALPVTGTQKVVKHRILASGEDPRDGAFDFRLLKKRDATTRPNATAPVARNGSLRIRKAP